MKQFGIYLLIFGIGSVLLHFIGLEFRLLMWIETWGEEVGWAIRAAMVILGVILFVVGQSQEAAAGTGELPPNTPAS
ncbi:MAG: hypothetical protein ACAI35_16300 [Candidatus Methylacidiphilales bacterium]|nr:hypothetical protein [Candidatus Methylacidiphilales bacterium]